MTSRADRADGGLVRVGQIGDLCARGLDALVAGTTPW